MIERYLDVLVFFGLYVAFWGVERWLDRREAARRAQGDPP